MVVTKRGVSPRIVEAKLIGTGGTTTVTGEQLEIALGGHDTWMTFEKVVGGKRGPTAPGESAGAGGPAGSGLAAQPSG